MKPPPRYETGTAMVIPQRQKAAVSLTRDHSIIAGSTRAGNHRIRPQRTKERDSGEGRGEYWRKGWDLNPRYGSPHGSFQDCCLKPLGHPSIPICATFWNWRRFGADIFLTPFSFNQLGPKSTYFQDRCLKPLGHSSSPWITLAAFSKREQPDSGCQGVTRGLYSFSHCGVNLLHRAKFADTAKTVFQHVFQPIILPGFMMPFGSMVFLIACMRLSLTGSISACNSGFFSRPIPCSAEKEPPISFRLA
jgi:hypothetical protein